MQFIADILKVTYSSDGYFSPFTSEYGSFREAVPLPPPAPAPLRMPALVIVTAAGFAWLTNRKNLIREGRQL